MRVLFNRSLLNAAVLTGALLMVVTPRAQAQIQFVLIPPANNAPSYTLYEGGTLNLNASILNTDPVNSYTVDSYSLQFTSANTFSINPPPAPPPAGGVTVDDTGFYNNFNTTFAPGNGVVNQNLFTFTADAAAPVGTYGLSLTLNDPNNNSLTQTNFEITILHSAAVPEASTLIGLGGLTLVGGLLTLRRKRAQSAPA